MVKLLFITQKVDLDDDVLGIYHHWIKKLSEKVEAINVICLYRGKVDLPRNVSIYSLGKEKLSNADLRGFKRGFTRIKYVIRFWKYIWSLRSDYDMVFVHMNPIYIILGGIFWKLQGKKILLWYNHPLGNFLAWLGIGLVERVFYTSPFSFAAKFKKSEQMPVGVDTDMFKKNVSIKKRVNSILYLGRISPVKRIEYLIEAAKILAKQKIDFKITIIGSPVSSNDQAYLQSLKQKSQELITNELIEFKSGAPYFSTPSIYNSHEICVNLTPAGSFDKTIIEAMACETIVLASNPALEIFFDSELKSLCVFKERDSVDLAEKLSQLFLLSQARKQSVAQKLSDIAKKRHSLENLAEKLSQQLFL